MELGLQRVPSKEAEVGALQPAVQRPLSLRLWPGPFLCLSSAASALSSCPMALSGLASGSGVWAPSMYFQSMGSCCSPPRSHRNSPRSSSGTWTWLGRRYSLANVGHIGRRTERWVISFSCTFHSTGSAAPLEAAPFLFGYVEGNDDLGTGVLEDDDRGSITALDSNSTPHVCEGTTQALPLSAVFSDCVWPCS